MFVEQPRLHQVCLLQVTGDTKLVKPDTWHVTHDTWHVTQDTWHLTHNTWLGEQYLKRQVSKYYNFGEPLFWRYFYKRSVSHLNDKAVCRTAPATLGLSIRGLVLSYWKLNIMALYYGFIKFVSWSVISIIEWELQERNKHVFCCPYFVNLNCYNNCYLVSLKIEKNNVIFLIVA